MARLAHPAAARERWLLVIAYLDAAGTHSRARVFSLAVYVANEAQWAAFEDAWKRMLADENPPLTRLHMTDLEASWGEFKTGWDRERKDKLLARAAGIIQDHVEMGFADVVDVKSYRRVLATPLKFSLVRRQREFANPHVISLWNNLALIYNVVVDALPAGERVAPIADREDRPLRAILNRHYEQMILSNARFAKHFDPGLSFKSSVDFVPLQAADYLAWESANELRQSLRPFYRDPIRPSFQALWTPPKVQVHFFTAPKIVRLRRRAERERIL